MVGERDQCQRILDGHSAGIHAIRMTKDGSYCMTASADRTIKLWNPHKTNPATKKQDPDPHPAIEEALCIQTYAGVHGYPVLDVVITQDKARFASAGEDRACFLWDVGSSRVIRRIQAHDHRINAVAFNSYDSVLYTASYDRTLKCWDLRSNTSRDPIQTMDDFKDSVTSIAQTDYCILAASIDGAVRIYDLRKGLMHADQLQDPVTSITVSPDNQTYLATLLGGHIRLIDLEMGKQLKVYRGHLHTSFKQESCFAFGDKEIVTGSEDGSIYHYNLLSAEVTGVTKYAHFKAISAIAYHPSADLFLTASHDGLAKVWKPASI
eukprot:gene8018-8844_t